MSNPNPPLPYAPAPRWLIWAVVIALIGFGVSILWNATTVAGGSDSSGYLNSARLLAVGELQTPLRIPPEVDRIPEVKRNQFTPLGFTVTPRADRIAPTYPTGLPLHFAAAARVTGWRAGPMLVVVLAATAAVGLCYLSGRELGLSPALSICAATLLAAFPVFLFTSLQPMSDTLATTWCLAALYAGLRARRSTSWAAGAGLALAIAVLVRPTNIMLTPALLVLLGLNVRKLAAFVISGLPAAAWLLFYNHHQYGSPLGSGYGDVSTGFALHYGAPTLVHFLKWLGLLLPGVVLVLPFVALSHRDTRGMPLLALTLMFAGIAGLYVFYHVSHETWWCLRFIVPAVPALILAAMLGVEALARGRMAGRATTFRRAAAITLGLWAVIASSIGSSKLHLWLVPYYEQVYEDAVLAAKEQLPDDALVAACAFSGTLYYYTDLAMLRFDLLDPGDFARYVNATRSAGRPVYALIFDAEEADLRTRCPGEWERVATVEHAGLWRLP